MDFKKPTIIAEVPLRNRFDGHPEEGKVVGTAKIEKLPGGDLVAHIDARGMTGEMLRRGFSIPPLSISIKEENNASGLET